MASTSRKIFGFPEQSSNELGLDTDYVAAGLAWAAECCEKGFITKEETKGLELRFGDGQVLLRLMNMLVNREAIGDLLADGIADFCISDITLLCSFGCSYGL